MIMYHGYSDPLIPARSSVIFHDHVRQAMGADDVDSLYKLYLMPGVLHCFGSANRAPWSIGGVSQGYCETRNTSPGYVDNADHNAVLSLIRG
jgi:hypothetical protein